MSPGCDDETRKRTRQAAAAAGRRLLINFKARQLWFAFVMGLALSLSPLTPSLSLFPSFSLSASFSQHHSMKT